MNYIFPLLLIILSNTLYNITAKATPGAANPLLSLFFTYITAAFVTVIALLITGLPKPTQAAIGDLNWTSFALGLAIVGLELGYLFAYRRGMPISIGSLIANMGLAIVLAVIGILFYKEHLGVNQTIGIALCLAGLFFLNRP